MSTTNLPKYELGEITPEVIGDISYLSNNFPDLLARARDNANTRADSYRNFHVGAVGVALDDIGEYVVVDGWNTKEDPKAEKVCAEDRVLAAAMGANAVRMVAMIVVGTSDVDKIREVNPNHPHPTLRPCDRCTERISKSSLITDNTVIITAGIEDDIAQIFTSGHLETDKNEPWASASFNPKNWAKARRVFGEGISSTRYEVVHPLFALLAAMRASLYADEDEEN